VDGTDKIILASKSTARARVLRDAGVDFDVIVSGCEERETARADQMAEVCEWNARAKAEAVATESPGRVVVAADTLVSCGEEVLAQPTDAGDARRMMRLHCEHPSVIITGQAVSISFGAAPITVSGLAESVVRTLLLTEGQIDDYVASGIWEGKSGAYGIEQEDDGIAALESGDLDTVIGISVPLVREQMARLERQLPAL
jgi:septum formation protein